MNKKLKMIIFNMIIIVAIVIIFLFVSSVGHLTNKTNALGCPGYPLCSPFDNLEIFDCTELICGYGTWGVCLKCVREV